MPDPRLPLLSASSTSDVLMDRSIRHALFLERFKTQQATEIIDVLNRKMVPDLLTSLEKELPRVLAAGRTTSRRLERLEGMLEASDGIIKGGIRQISEPFKSSMKAFAASEANWQKAVFEKHVPLDFSYKSPSTATLNALITKKPMRGRVLRSWFNSIETSAKQRVRDQVNIGIGVGDSVPQIVTRLRGTKARAFIDGAMQITRRNANSVVRTAINDVSASAREATYAANSDIIKGVKYLATLDGRTTDICISLDGQVFPINSGPRPPQHFACRSTTTPVLKSLKEIGLSNKELKQIPLGTRASMNGQVPSTITYQQWLRKQPRKFQDSVLGPSKAKLFRRGKLDLSRGLVNKRGQSLTLKQLQRKDNPTARFRKRNKIGQVVDKGRPIDVSTAKKLTADTLPTGWTVETRTKSTTGAKFKVYTSPQGKKFYSLKQVERHLDVIAPPPVVPSKLVTPPLPKATVVPPATGAFGLEELRAGKFPDGWRTLVRTKSTTGQEYKVYVAPNGKKFYSLKKVDAFLRAQSKAVVTPESIVVTDASPILPAVRRGTAPTTVENLKPVRWDAKAHGAFTPNTLARGKDVREQLLALQTGTEAKLEAKLLDELAVNLKERSTHAWASPEYVKLATVYDRTSAKLLNVQKQLRTKMRATLELPANERSTVKISKQWTVSSSKTRITELPSNVTDGIDFVQSVISKRAIHNGAGGNIWTPAFRMQSSRLDLQIAWERRTSAFYNSSEHAIHICKLEKVNTIVHEIAHGIDHGENLVATSRFLDERIAATTDASKRRLRKLQAILPRHGFTSNEVAFEDKFIDAYMGKHYAVGLNRRRSSEILSMGLEKLYKNPALFAQQDPEMFDFIVDLIRGYIE